MSDSENAEIIAVFNSVEIGNNFAAVAIGLIVYELTITFDKEVDLFWRRKFTPSSALFLVNRYVPLVVNMIFAPWPSLPTSPAGCKALVQSAMILEIFQYVPWAVFAGLRAYVLSSRAWPLAVLVSILSLAPVVINYVGFLQDGLRMETKEKPRYLHSKVTLGYAVPYVDPLLGWGVTSTLTDAVQQDFTVVSRACLITSDLLVLAITWTATYKNSKEMRLLGQNTSLSSILFRDGVVYFIVLLIMNVLHLSFSLRSILNQNNTDNASYITILTEPITAILISRFLIDLQEANNGKHHPHTLSSVQIGQIGSLDFNRFVGSLSSSLAAPGEASTEHDPQHLHSNPDSEQSAAEGDGASWAQTTELGSGGFSGEAVSRKGDSC